MEFKNSRFAAYGKSLPKKAVDENRDIVLYADGVDEALGIDRSNDTVVWNSEVGGQVYSSDGSVFFCGPIRSIAVDSGLMHEGYSKNQVPKVKDEDQWYTGQ